MDANKGNGTETRNDVHVMHSRAYQATQAAIYMGQAVLLLRQVDTARSRDVASKVQALIEFAEKSDE